MFECNIHRLPIKDFISMIPRDDIETEMDTNNKGAGDEDKEAKAWRPEHREFFHHFYSICKYTFTDYMHTFCGSTILGFKGNFSFSRE